MEQCSLRFVLSWLGSAFGLRVAERIAVSFAVLTFFWGAFALIGAATRRAPWRLSPLLAVFAYGWTFEMGFMNYYISLGLCFFALALFGAWREWRAADRLGLDSVDLDGASARRDLLLAGWRRTSGLAKAVRPRYHEYLLLAAGIFLLGVRMFLARHYAGQMEPLGPLFLF